MYILKNIKKISLATVAAATLGTASTFAVIEYDQNVTPDVIFGSGNANGSFTTDRSNGIELGLRGKLRHNAGGAPENTFNSNGDGTYSFEAGVAPTQSAPTGVWSVEWSINTDYLARSIPTSTLNSFTYALGIDIDPTAGTLFTTFDLINGVNSNNGQVFWDHAIGDNATPNGGGTAATDAANYASLIDTYNVAQNSWKAHWIVAGYDPTIDATYDFTLTAYDGQTEVAKTSIQIIQGKGGSPVSDASSTAVLLGAGILGLLGFRRFSKRA